MIAIKLKNYNELSALRKVIEARISALALEARREEPWNVYYQEKKPEIEKAIAENRAAFGEEEILYRIYYQIEQAEAFIQEALNEAAKKYCR